MIRLSIFLAGAAIIGLGFLGTVQMEKNAGLAFLLGALTLGGGFFICGIFSIKMPWHGVIGAGVLALLGVGRGLINLPDFAKFIVGERDRGNAPVLEMAVLVICAFLLARVLHEWSQERIRKLKDP